MTADLSSVAREAAEQEWTRSSRAGDAELYIAGFTECASRIPSDEELAAEMKRHHFADNLLGNITWDMWMSKCECGWESSEYRYPGESSDAYYAHAAGDALINMQNAINRLHERQTAIERMSTPPEPYDLADIGTSILKEEHGTDR